jgi:hypothetical protein
MSKVFQLDPETHVPILKSPVVVSKDEESAGEPVGLNEEGKLDASVLPSEVGIAVRTYTANGALAANDLVNVYYNESQTRWEARKADASNADSYASGFVKTAATAGSTVSVYLDGSFTLSSDITSELTSNRLFLSTTPGKPGNYDPEAVIYQVVGFRIGDTIAEFEPSAPVVQIADDAE